MDEAPAKVSLVTGAGQGVGRGVALALAARGDRVVVLGRTKAKLDAVVTEIEERGGTAVADVCDIERGAETAAAVRRAVDRFGRIDVLVNNAQTKVYQTIRRLTEDDMEHMWQSGPMATFRLMQQCFDHLRASKGSVVNMGSGSSVLPQAMMSGYAMTKEAVRMLTRVAAVEWGKFGIRVNAVCPLAESPGFDSFNAQTPGVLEDHIIPNVPLGRIGDPEADVGRAVVFLTSDDASYITGTTLMVDGGYNFLR